MRTSESTAKIVPALLAAQRAMKAATKSSENPHFKSKYADLASILEAVKPPLNAAGIVVAQGVTSDDRGVMVETMLIHESAEWIADTLFLPVPQQTPQAYGSAITYGRRYSLQSLVALPAEDDDGTKASEGRRDGGARQETVDTLNNMSAEEQRFIRKHAEIVLSKFDDGNGMEAAKAATQYLGEQRLDSDEKTALWSILPSNIRSALKLASQG